VWIYKGDVTSRELAREQAAAPRAPRREGRGDGPRDRAARPQRRRPDSAPSQDAAPAAAAPTAQPEVATPAEQTSGTEA